MTGFTNPIVAGLRLLINSIQSTNFVAGVSGWAINKNGTAEFNSLTIRGATVEDTVSLWYAGTPGLGTLAISISATAGVDPFGNSYPVGLSVYYTGSTKTFLQTGLNGNPFFTITNGTTNFTLGVEDSFSGIGVPNLVGNAGALIPSVLLPQANSSNQPIWAAHTITAIPPGSSSPEDWHFPSLATGWATVGGASPRYRFEPIGQQGVIRLAGEVTTTGAGPWPKGTTLFTVPYNSTYKSLFVNNSTITVTGGQATIGVTNTGQVQTGQAMTAAGQFLALDGMTYSLD